MILIDRMLTSNVLFRSLPLPTVANLLAKYPLPPSSRMWALNKPEAGYLALGVVGAIVSNSATTMGFVLVDEANIRQKHETVASSLPQAPASTAHLICYDRQAICRDRLLRKLEVSILAFKLLHLVF